MKQEKINQIYEMLLKRLILTQETLSIYNFNEEEINELINNGVLKEENNKSYTLASIDGLYRYGIKQLLNKLDKKADACFRICHTLDPNNREVCIQLLLMYLKNRNYIAAEKMFAIIENINHEENIEDNKLYLYMLSLILFRNKEYQERLNNINLEEILLPINKEYKHREKQNEIRRALINKKYKYAMKLINDLMREEFVYSSELELLKELVTQAIELDKKFKQSIKNALARKDYIRILELLEMKSQNQYLTNMETYIKIVTNAIIETKETQTIPVITIHSTNLLYEALNGNNFKLAREINTQFLIRTEQNVEEDILNILLNDLITSIEKLEEKEFATQFKKPEIQTTITSSESIKLAEELETENNANELSIDLSSEEEWAYYIKQENMSIEQARKSFGLLPEQALLIKLIYARDYYIEGTEETIFLADELLNEVEINPFKTEKIIQFLKEIKQNKDTSAKNKTPYTRKRELK